jgi:hypothetical protein
MVQNTRPNLFLQLSIVLSKYMTAPNLFITFRSVVILPEGILYIKIEQLIKIIQCQKRNKKIILYIRFRLSISCTSAADSKD